MKKVIRLTESEFISLVKKVINESKNGNVNEQMSTMANAVKAASAQGPEPSWLKYPKAQYMSIQPNLRMANPSANVTTAKPCFTSIMDASFGFIIGQNTKFVAKGNFFVGAAFRVEKSKIDTSKIGNPAYLNGVIANAQKFGLTSTQVALTQDGSVLFPNGDTPFKLYGDAGFALAETAKKSFR